MKMRFYLPLLLAMLACSAPGLAPRPTVEPLVFPTSVLETVTPVHTLDPLIPTLDLGPAEQTSATPTVLSATATLSAELLSDIKISTDRVYYGNDCSPSDVTFNVTVSQPEKVSSVLLFVRLRSQKTGAQSAWNTGRSMRPLGSGQYEYPLRVSQVANHREYSPAWLLYQFVLTDSRGEVVARSQIFSDKIKLERDCP